MKGMRPINRAEYEALLLEIESDDDIPRHNATDFSLRPIFRPICAGEPLLKRT